MLYLVRTWTNQRDLPNQAMLFIKRKGQSKRLSQVLFDLRASFNVAFILFSFFNFSWFCPLWLLRWAVPFDFNHNSRFLQTTPINWRTLERIVSSLLCSLGASVFWHRHVHFLENLYVWSVYTFWFTMVLFYLCLLAPTLLLNPFGMIHLHYIATIWSMCFSIIEL